MGTDVRDAIAEVENRVKVLEDLVNELLTNIASLSEQIKKTVK